MLLFVVASEISTETMIVVLVKEKKTASGFVMSLHQPNVIHDHSQLIEPNIGNRLSLIESGDLSRLGLSAIRVWKQINVCAFPLILICRRVNNSYTKGCRKIWHFRFRFRILSQGHFCSFTFVPLTSFHSFRFFHSISKK